jgi:TorA maturation chaperone TorD
MAAAKLDAQALPPGRERIPSAEVIAPRAGSLEPDQLRLLSSLWLREPDPETARLASSRLGLPVAEPAELAVAYAELFLLNVYPYGTVFTDPYGELNGPGAQEIARLYAANGYQPAVLLEIGAPDHLGACLGFVAHLSQKQLDRVGFTAALLDWAPVCCLAVEREPTAHPLYQSFAKLTREWLLADESWTPSATHSRDPLLLELSSSSDEEVRLRDLVRFFLAPARCGIFLSRGRLGRMALNLGLRLPFGSRFEVAETLFQVAGEAGQVEPLIDALETEINIWRTEYARWAESQPKWQATAEMWLARTTKALGQLGEMRQAVTAGQS